MRKIINFLSNHLKRFVYLYLALAVLAGGLFSYLYINIVPTCHSNYVFINPEPVCEVSENEDLESLTNTRGAVESYVNAVQNTDGINHVSVFYRNLTTRRWFGVNENENFTPASILKLPIGIAVLKLREVDENVLNKELLFVDDQSSNNNQAFRPPSEIENGKSYRVDDLLFRMLAYSDNKSTVPIADFLNPSFLKRVFVDLGIDIPVAATELSAESVEFISVKSYAAIFRALYNASYLNRANSEKILGILAQSSFVDGLVGGVPANMKVAHKFGERLYVNDAGTTERQLHDCGIIYKPDNPYILCVMTKGSNLTSLGEVIRHISGVVYAKN